MMQTHVYMQGGKVPIEEYHKGLSFNEYDRTIRLIDHNKFMGRPEMVKRLEARKAALEERYPDFPEARKQRMESSK